MLLNKIGLVASILGLFISAAYGWKVLFFLNLACIMGNYAILRIGEK